MSVAENQSAVASADIWFTRCPVPTATGLAYRLGWLEREFAQDGITVRTLQNEPEFRRHHYDHQLPGLVREGGNMLALAARAQGARTRLVGLTWIEERQAIVVREGSGITAPEDLRGRRLALPSYVSNPIASHVRGSSIARGMSVSGYYGVLHAAGLSFDDVELVEVEAAGSRDRPLGTRLWALDALVAGKVDALYVKGASAVDAARAAGVVVGIDLDQIEDRRYRVNNGTPRPITVHEDFVETRFEHLVRFLQQTILAADWAADHAGEVLRILSDETQGSMGATADAYGATFHATLHPDLSDERLALLNRQKKQLWLHGFLDHDFPLSDWVDTRPLQEAWRRVRGG